MSNAIPVTLQQRCFPKNQPFTTLLSVTSAACSCLVNEQRGLAFMCVRTCVRAACVCALVRLHMGLFMPVQSRDEAREGARVRGESGAGHKGCGEARHWEGGERKLK